MLHKLSELIILVLHRPYLYNILIKIWTKLNIHLINVSYCLIEEISQPIFFITNLLRRIDTLNLIHDTNLLFDTGDDMEKVVIHNLCYTFQAAYSEFASRRMVRFQATYRRSHVLYKDQTFHRRCYVYRTFHLSILAIRHW